MTLQSKYKATKQYWRFISLIKGVKLKNENRHRLDPNHSSINYSFENTSLRVLCWFSCSALSTPRGRNASFRPTLKPYRGSGDGYVCKGQGCEYYLATLSIINVRGLRWDCQKQSNIFMSSTCNRGQKKVNYVVVLSLVVLRKTNRERMYLRTDEAYIFVVPGTKFHVS